MGADINSPDKNGRTPLLWAAKAGNLSVLELLLERGVWIDHVDIDGNAAIHVAAHVGNIEIVRMLLDYGASIVVENKRGLTCLEIAMDAQNCEVVMVIIKHNRWVRISAFFNPTQLVNELFQQPRLEPSSRDRFCSNRSTIRLFQALGWQCCEIHY